MERKLKRGATKEVSRHRCRHEQCNYSSSRMANVLRHVRTMHSTDAKQDLRCCGLGFLDKAALRHHTRQIHSGGYNCAECGKSFSRKSILKRHFSSHSGHRTHHCHICDYSTTNSYNLERHVAIHFRSSQTAPSPDSTTPAHEFGKSIPTPSTSGKSNSSITHSISSILSRPHPMVRNRSPDENQVAQSEVPRFLSYPGSQRTMVAPLTELAPAHESSFYPCQPSPILNGDFEGAQDLRVAPITGNPFTPYYSRGPAVAAQQGPIYPFLDNHPSWCVECGYNNGLNFQAPAPVHTWEF